MLDPRSATAFRDALVELPFDLSDVRALLQAAAGNIGPLLRRQTGVGRAPEPAAAIVGGSDAAPASADA